MLNDDRSTWTDPDTEVNYDLDHFLSFTTAYEIRFPNETREVETLISFSNHCYTRSWREGDDERYIVDRQTLKNGNEDIRVFCSERWAFSVNLREIIEELLYKTCLMGGNQEILYRQEDAPRPGDHSGWYICMRLAYRPDEDIPFQIWVRSVHHRDNRPEDVRGGPTKFCILAKRYLEKRLF